MIIYDLPQEVAEVVFAALDTDGINKSVTKFLDSKTVIRLKLRTYKQGSVDPKSLDFHLHIGKPNFAERQAIAKRKRDASPTTQFPFFKIKKLKKK